MSLQKLKRLKCPFYGFSENVAISVEFQTIPAVCSFVGIA